MTSHVLSKSQFMRGLQCAKSLWLDRYHPEWRSTTEASHQAVLDAGIQVGFLARKLFPDGKTIEFKPDDVDAMVSETQAHIASGTETLYEAAFIHNGVLVLVDILHKGPGGWELYEVKSSTRVKSSHEIDVALQYHVVKGAGLDLSSASLIHINNRYARQGHLELGKLFSCVDLTANVLYRQTYLENDLDAMRGVLEGEMPEIDIGPYCSSPSECDFTAHCWSHIPESSIFNLTRLSGEKKFELYYKGIVNLNDLPHDFHLTRAQKIQVEAERDGNETFQRKQIGEFLNTLFFPLYFLDFETFQSVIPPFENLRPYELIPFQYSLHYLDQEHGELQHREFLALEGTDPRQAIAESLVSAIPRGACILAYNARFEKNVIKWLAHHCPALADSLLALNEHLIDLMKPFQKKHVYKKEMKGSYSIKSVLPALAPQHDYADLEIANGRAAMHAYATLVLMENEEEKEKVRAHLREYCLLDTLGMVTLWKKLKELH